MQSVNQRSNHKMKKVLIISTSLRGVSNSHLLAEAFARGTRDAGNDVELLTLHGKEIKFCLGCLSCQKTGKCVIKDDIAPIVEKMHDADVLVFATPIYYYEMSGQLKTVLDRANPLYGGDYRFKDVYMLTSAADDDNATPQRAISGLEGWIECFERARLAGTVFAGGVTAPGEISGHASLETAYGMGNKI